MKGSKRYGRRSTPEFIEPFSDSPEVKNANLAEEEEEDREDSDDSAVPRKREVRHQDSIFITSSVFWASMARQRAVYSWLISLAAGSQRGSFRRNMDAKRSVDGTRLYCITTQRCLWA